MLILIRRQKTINYIHWSNITATSVAPNPKDKKKSWGLKTSPSEYCITELMFTVKTQRLLVFFSHLGRNTESAEQLFIDTREVCFHLTYLSYNSPHPIGHVTMDKVSHLVGSQTNGGRRQRERCLKLKSNEEESWYLILNVICTFQCVFLDW